MSVDIVGLIYVAMTLVTIYLVGHLMIVGKIKHSFDNSGEFTCFCGILGILWPITWSIMCAGFIFGLIRQIVKGD